MSKFTWYYNGIKFDNEAAKLYAAGIRDVPRMVFKGEEIWGRSAPSVIASGDWWTLYSNGLLNIYRVGVMPDFGYAHGYSQPYVYPPWHLYCANIKSVVIDSVTTSIGQDAFYQKEIGNEAYEYTRLTSVTIPNSVTSIGETAFYDCQNLTDIAIPDSVISFGTGAFSGCYSLLSVKIPNSMTTVGWSAFGSCHSLRYVIIPSGVTHIESQAFADCPNLTDIYYAGTQAQWNAITIDSDNTPLTSATIHYNSTGP